MASAVCLLLLTYLLAAVPFGLVLATLFGGDLDIRSEGSGNIGATNVARLYGWRVAAPVLLLDLAKGLVPVLLADQVVPGQGVWWPCLVGLVAYLGHCYPVYLSFRGGKGVATGAGVMLALAPGPALAAIATWALVLFATGRSSASSLAAVVVLIASVAAVAPAILPLGLVLGFWVVQRHIANIRRLVIGAEDAIIRPVRWGRAADVGADPEALLAAGPSGSPTAAPVWREVHPDPLDATEWEPVEE